jgi:accessory secretory protein Asp1
MMFDNEQPLYQDYLNDKGVWVIRYYYNDGHVDVNQNNNTYLIEYNNKEYVKSYMKLSYDSIEQVITEVLSAYLIYTEQSDIFCVAVHKLHLELLKHELKNKKLILSYYGERFDIKHSTDDLSLIDDANYIIADSIDNLNRLKQRVKQEINNITDITPFDTRVDFGISQQLNVQKILVHYVKRVFKIHPVVFVKAVPKLVLIQSNTIIHFTFDLINELDDKLLLQMADLSITSLYKLILHDDTDVRKSLFNCLMKIESISREKKLK